jgi:hypothetical protein
VYIYDNVCTVTHKECHQHHVLVETRICISNFHAGSGWGERSAAQIGSSYRIGHGMGTIML